MQVKTFEAKTMAEALSNVKNEMGPDAVIISTKNTRKGAGSFGLFGVPRVEVTAAMGSPKKGKEEKKSSSEPEDLSLLREELKDIKGLLLEMAQSGKSSNITDTAIYEGFESLHATMIQAGVSPRLAAKLVEKSQIFLGDRTDKAARTYLAKEALARSIMDTVRVSPDLEGKGYEKGRAIAFVGPTGVGKTTTLAKLAAHYNMKLGKDVALITIDTYRIGAVEQLKIYADILKVPMEVASTPKDLREKVKSFSDKDIILIDTAGGNQRDHSRISLLKDFFMHNDIDVQIQLLASATTKAADMVDILDKFGELPIQRYIVTKLDESTRFGALLNIAARYKVPYSYFTTGQKVPEDIEPATAERVADLILEISTDNTLSSNIQN